MKVLGICGSPRKGATEWSMMKALETLDGYPGIETVYWSVRGKKWVPVFIVTVVSVKTVCVPSR